MIFPELMRKYLPLWVAISISLELLMGYRLPGIKTLGPAIPFLLFVMLYPMMINLRVEDIGKALKNLKLFSVAILMNFLLTPLLYLNLSERIRMFLHPETVPEWNRDEKAQQA